MPTRGAVTWARFNVAVTVVLVTVPISVLLPLVVSENVPLVAMVYAGEVCLLRRNIEDVTGHGMISLNEKDNLTAAGEIALVETTFAFFCARSSCQRKQ